MHMLSLFLLTFFVFYLPSGLFLWTICFVVFNGLLKYRRHAIAKLAMLLISAAAIVGILYGSLRFAGVITFPSDNTMSWNWFDASWRDDGFKFIHACSCVLIGLASSVLFERNRHCFASANHCRT